ncbi:MAG TPA: hypothetical protein VFB18_02960 [Methyloceanibacter sp.]|nr:hypothetical protein [Methyloceanibacter sp.]
MFAILSALGTFVADLLKSRCRLEAESLLLRHQLTIVLRRAPPRPRLFGSDRALLIMDDADLAEPAWCGAGGSAGDRSAMASRWVQNVLAVEIAS